MDYAKHHIERLHVDGELLEKVLPTAKHFFQHCVLPELLSKWYSRMHSMAIPAIDRDNREADDEDDGSWCYCKEDISGEIIIKHAQISGTTSCA